MGNGVGFIGLCPNVLLMEEGYPVGMFLGHPAITPGNVAGIPLLETYQHPVGIALQIWRLLEP